MPLLDGGGQEGGLRGSTLNVPGIVGMGAAAALAREALPEEAPRLRTLRDRMEAAFLEAYPGARINGRAAPRLPQTTNVTFPGLRADRLMTRLRSLAVSAGSACATGSHKPSHVLKALGLSGEDAAATLRFSLGRFTTEEEVDFAIRAVREAIRGEAVEA